MIMHPFQHKHDIQHWRDSPLDFVRVALGVKPMLWQEQALKALAGHEHLAIRSGHGVGKTAFLAWAILWWIVTRYPVKIACTAPTAHQLEDILWGELKRWYYRMPRFLQKQFEITQDRLYLKTDPQGCMAVARSVRKENSESIQGFHSPNMMFVFDEASGIDDAVYEAAAGALSTQGARAIMAGNPTRCQGLFYRSFHHERTGWWTAHVPCQNSHLVDKNYIQRIKNLHGEHSNVYRVRVLGEFPLQNDDQMIALEWVEAAMKRPATTDKNQLFQPVWGLDVARFGDDLTALAKRQGHQLLEPIRTWYHQDTMQIVGWVMEEYHHTPHHQKPSHIAVDAVGLGAGVVDRLAELGLPVTGVACSERAKNTQRFHRLRDELWFQLREWLRAPETSIPYDTSLISQLTTPHYSLTSDGKLRVESKDQMKKRGLGSPDLADALCLTMAITQVLYEEVVTKRRRYEHIPKIVPVSWMGA